VTRAEESALRSLERAARKLSPLDHDPRCGCCDCHEENQIHRALYRVDLARKLARRRARRGGR